MINLYVEYSSPFTCNEKAAFSERDNLLVFYYLRLFKSGPMKRVDFSEG
jgi:hypothetical protein